MHEMRRCDRQMPEEAAWQVVDRCAYAVLAMTAEDGTPYAVPLNIARSGNSIYFHSAMEGRKVTALRKASRVCLTCVGDAAVRQERFTMLYESAMVFGAVCEITEDTEKIEALRLICQRHTPEYMAAFPQELNASLSHTGVWKITAEEISGKANR